MNNYELKLSGMVLSSMPVGENDRRIVLLTRERGKISAFARGARRPKSPLVACTNPFAAGSFFAWPGRDSYSVHAAEIKTYFTDLTSDIERVWYGYLFLEMAEYFAMENVDETERLVLLYQALRALSKEAFDPELVRSVYEAKTLAIDGFYPNVFACASCGREDHLTAYSARNRGVVCEACVRKGIGGRPITPSTLYTLKFIFQTPSKSLFSFALSDETKQEFISIISAHFKSQIDHEFSSEEFLDLH